MKLTTTLAFLVGSGSAMIAAPAAAQYGASAPAPTVKVPTQPEAAATPGRKFDISTQARKEIIALQAAVNAKNTAAIPAALAAAQAKAKTNDDKYVIAQLQLRVAIDAKDNAAIKAAIESVIASNATPPSESVPLYNNLGQLQLEAKEYDKAAASFERSLQLAPSDVNAMVLLAETRNAQGRAADAVGLLQKAIAARVAAGQKADETWYKREVALAYKAKLPVAPALARDWASAYPSPKSWRDAIVIYQTSSGLPEEGLIDVMRLAHAAGAMAGENDYYRFANALVLKGFPGEAKVALDQGFASNAISKSSPIFSQIYATATTKSQGDRASLAGSAKTALAGSAVKPVMVTADAYYGYGDYTQAVELYRAALTKAGVDKDLTNLRLGMALGRAGDKAGAIATLKSVGGAQAEIAKLWMAYLSTKA